MPLEKLNAFTKKVSDLADKPNSTMTAAEVKAQFDAAPDEVRVYLNKLIDVLQSDSVGDSGADNIRARAIPELTGDTVQSILESLKALDDSNRAYLLSQIGGVVLGQIPAKTITMEKLSDEVTAHWADGAAHGIGNKETLATTHKSTIVGAINEAFQSGNSRKQELVDALLLLEPSLPISHASSWEEIRIATGQISTGVKKATGVLNSSATQTSFTWSNGASGNSYYLDILFTDLGFEPSIIYGYTQQKNYGVDNLFVWTRENYYESGASYANALSNKTYFRAPKLADRYRIPASYINAPHIWIAIE